MGVRAVPNYLNGLKSSSQAVSFLEEAHEMSSKVSPLSVAYVCGLANGVLLVELIGRVVNVAITTVFCFLDLHESLNDSAHRVYCALADCGTTMTLLFYLAHKPLTALWNAKRASQDFKDLKNHLILQEANVLAENGPTKSKLSDQIETLRQLTAGVEQKKTLIAELMQTLGSQNAEIAQRKEVEALKITEATEKGRVSLSELNQEVKIEAEKLKTIKQEIDLATEITQETTSKNTQLLSECEALEAKKNELVSLTEAAEKNNGQLQTEIDQKNVQLKSLQQHLLSLEARKEELKGANEAAKKAAGETLISLTTKPARRKK